MKKMDNDHVKKRKNSSSFIQKMVFPIRLQIRILRDKAMSRMTKKRMEEYVDKAYEKKFKRHINWSNPDSYTEKTNVSKIYGANELRTHLTDTIGVRDYVAEKIGDQYLVPLIGVYDKFSDIQFDKLPDKYVIKCNHDSASTTIVEKRLTGEEISSLKIIYDYRLKRNFAYKGFELHYKDIKPRIMIEQFLGSNIRDYKFLCFNGCAYYCWVDCDRFHGHKRNIYDMEWRIQPFRINYNNYGDEIEKPENFMEMKLIAEKLSAGFDHVRVDLYNVDGKVYFGEMTFTCENGMGKFYPDEWDYKVGELWDFRSKNYSNC